MSDETKVESPQSWPVLAVTILGWLLVGSTILDAALSAVQLAPVPVWVLAVGAVVAKLLRYGIAVLSTPSAKESVLAAALVAASLASTLAAPSPLPAPPGGVPGVVPVVAAVPTPDASTGQQDAPGAVSASGLEVSDVPGTSGDVVPADGLVPDLPPPRTH